MPAHIFLSHASADDNLVDPMIAAIQKAGFEVWADHLGLHPGDSWSGSIDQMLNECEAVIFALSPNSAQSKYCTAEWQKALMLKKRLYIARIAPITIPATPTRLVIEQHADLTQNWDAGLAELIDALQDKRALDPTSPVTAAPRKIAGYFPHYYLDLPLIGRDEDMKNVRNHLNGGGTRVTVVLGMGGVGKTRLAVEIAALADPTKFPDGVIWHKIEEMTSPDRLTELVRDHLGLPLTSEPDAVWQEAGKRRALIILDNAEACKQPEAYARLVNGTDISGGTRFLMTSRLDWPNLQHRQRHDLRQPDLDAATAILGKMIEQHPPRFSLNGHEREIAEAAQRHPRLMEYAVRWADKFPADKVLATLHELKGRSAEEALDDMVLKTVRQVESLPNGAAAITALRRLAVCRGGFTYAAAEQLMDDTEDLDLLVSWNLVGVKDERYEIDPLVIAAVGEDESAHRVHYDFYLALAWAHHEKQDYLGLDVESQNLEVAFEWALRVGDGEAGFWLMASCRAFLPNRLRYVQHMDWMLRVNTVLQGITNKPLWAMVQNDLGTVYLNHPLGSRRVNLQQAIEAFQAALTVRTAEVVPLDYAMIQNNLGVAYQDLAQMQDRVENLTRAIAAYHEALRFRTPQTMPYDYANTQINLANSHMKLAEVQDPVENLTRAIAAYHEALRFLGPTSAPLNYGLTLNNLGVAYHDLSKVQDRVDNLKRAIETYREALHFRTPDTAPHGYAQTQNNLGSAYMKLAEVQDLADNLTQAIASYNEALLLLRPDSTPLDYAMIQHNLGITYRALAKAVDREINLDLAITAFTEALRFYTPDTSPYNYIYSLLNRAAAYEDQGNLKATAVALRDAIQVAAVLGEDEWVAKYTEVAEQVEAKLREGHESLMSSE